jgi:hypothetical protein
MTLRLLVIGALGLILGTGIAGSSRTDAQSASTPFSVLVTELLSLFPKVDGDVIEVRGSEVTVALGKREGIQAGIELALYRPGRELRHPKTGEVLGHTEQSLGRVRITQAFEAYSLGTLAGGRGVVPGDRARISAGPIPVTLVSLVDRVGRSLAETATQEIFDGLNRSGRFRVTWGDQVTAYLSQERITPDGLVAGERVGEIAAKLKVDYLLVLRFRTVDKKPFMDVRLFTGSQRDALLTTAQFVPASLRPADQKGFSAGGAERGRKVVKERSLLARLLSGDSEPLTYSSGEGAIPLKELARFPFAARGFDVAVAPADGIPRLTVTDGEKIYLYRIVEERLEPEWTYAVKPFGTIFSLQLADLDGDGTLEVIVSRHHHSTTHTVGMVGFILGTRSGRPYVMVDDIDSIVLAVDDAGTGVKRTLWSQPYDREKFFTPGKIFQVQVRDGKLVRVGSPRVPDDLRGMAAAFSNVSGKANPRVLAYIDSFSRLKIAVDSEELWRSTTPVGGGGTKLEVGVPGSIERRSAFFFHEPMPLAVDLDNDGVEEIIVPQNVPQPGLLAVVFKGPTGFRIQSVNSGFEGTILGMGAIPGERPTLVAAVAHYKGALARTGETQIIVTVSTD